MSIGVKIIVMIIPKIVPIVESLTASYPLPCNKRLCAGKIVNALLSSGAPKNVEGMKSKKVCVIAIAIIMIARLIGSVYCNSFGEDVRIKTEMRFIWIPGVNPVMIPNRVPIKM